MGQLSDKFLIIFGHFSTFCHDSVCLGCPTICPLQVWGLCCRLLGLLHIIWTQHLATLWKACLCAVESLTSFASTAPNTVTGSQKPSLEERTPGPLDPEGNALSCQTCQAPFRRMSETPTTTTSQKSIVIHLHFVMPKSGKSEVLAKCFADMGEKCGEHFSKNFADVRPSISRRSGRKKFHKKMFTNSASRETKLFHREPTLGAWGHKYFLLQYTSSFPSVTERHSGNCRRQSLHCSQNDADALVPSSLYQKTYPLITASSVHACNMYLHSMRHSR